MGGTNPNGCLQACSLASSKSCSWPDFSNSVVSEYPPINLPAITRPHQGCERACMFVGSTKTCSTQHTAHRTQGSTNTSTRMQTHTNTNTNTHTHTNKHKHTMFSPLSLDRRTHCDGENLSSKTWSSKWGFYSQEMHKVSKEARRRHGVCLEHRPTLHDSTVLVSRARGPN